MDTYNEDTALAILKELKDWTFNNNGIEKKFVFKNFSEALGFIVQVGLLSEQQGHHPELFNVYNKVDIRLSTHDAKGVTDKDFDLAKAIDTIT
ncbi:4a-hydroxytetrahydrobiopterin dehydratase [Flavobacterium frigoris]|uniref:Putative pterin-4-alpha-carbinolamine dehydratase n=1 Tax=Flavobacterium frigoris (strain PS1) TaxID=1086011 RepID=H7FQQ6_FLAFP|nr:4a-hydroxytetrahydrobiopterin dehydratase [Flavobacterium frigoris]EIA09186.1 pterin-4-alpha-carbinolamine dehydratase [Flavobacterium frigoris PS1]